MKPYEVLELIAQDIEPGTRSRVLCPKCNGGESAETSLSLFRDHSNRIAWKCFRAKCGYSGAPKGVSGDSSRTSRIAPKYFTHPYEQVTRETPEGAFLYERYGISLANISWSVDVRRYVLPIIGPGGNLRGTVAYGFDTNTKAVSYRERVDEPWMHYTYRPSDATVCVVVEDWFSAQKIYTAGQCAVALLGTILNRERVDEIKQACRGLQVILALDLDAYGKSIKYALEYGGEFSPPLKVWRLKSDLKYVSTDRIKREVNGGIGDFARGNTRIKEGV